MDRFILIIGIAIILGSFGGRIFTRLRIPQVVGYIVIGVLAILVGGVWLQAITPEDIQKLEPISLFALAIIGFNIGGELKKEVFQKYGKGLIILLLSEGLAAAITVSALTGLVTCPWTELGHRTVIQILQQGNWALAILLGAIATATAPAATVDVFWEYNTRGILTTTVMAIVALDDGLALLLFSVASSMSDLLLGNSGFSVLQVVGKPLLEICGSVLLGASMGAAYAVVLKFFYHREMILPLCIGSLLILLAISHYLDLDLILAAMSSGVMVSNLEPRKSKEAFDQLSRFAPPIFVLFFVLVGARLQPKAMAGWMIILAVTYLIGRTGGKLLGAYLGSRWGRMPAKVRKYLGFCLFSQAGVAVGLATLAGHRLPHEMAQSVILVITATTFIVQIIGPPSVRFAVFKADEVGKDITEADLLSSHVVRDFMDSTPTMMRNDTPLNQILMAAAKSHALFYPVVDQQSRLVGMISFLEIKKFYVEENLNNLIFAENLMERVHAVTTPDVRLVDALDKMRNEDVEALPVVSDDNQFKLIGIIEERAIREALHKELVSKRQDEFA